MWSFRFETISKFNLLNAILRVQFISLPISHVFHNFYLLMFSSSAIFIEYIEYTYSESLSHSRSIRLRPVHNVHCTSISKRRDLIDRSSFKVAFLSVAFCKFAQQFSACRCNRLGTTQWVASFKAYFPGTSRFDLIEGKELDFALLQTCSSWKLLGTFFSCVTNLYIF